MELINLIREHFYILYCCNLEFQAILTNCALRDITKHLSPFLTVSLSSKGTKHFLSQIDPFVLETRQFIPNIFFLFILTNFPRDFNKM